MRNVLLIHHLEKTWERGYKQCGWSLYTLQRSIAVNLRRKKKSFDKIILTRFEQNTISWEDYPDLYDWITAVHEYNYGWRLASFIDDAEHLEEVHAQLESNGVYELRNDESIVKGGNHSEVVLIPRWLKELSNCKVTLCGAFDGECIEDIEIALTHCKINYKRWETFIL